MMVILVHHADALGPHLDPMRPLSIVGSEQAASLAARAAAEAIKPAAIWHSGKLRSRQTAEHYWRACNPFAEFKMVRGLRPEDPIEWMRDELEGEDRDVMLVGHMPHLPALARALCPGIEEFPLHGFVVLERVGPRAYVERSRERAAR